MNTVIRQKIFLFTALLVLFGSIAKSNTAHANCASPNLLIVLDKSGSMWGNSKWTNATNAIKTITNSYNGKLTFGLEVFTSSASIVYGINKCYSDRNRCVPNLQSTLNRYRPGGGTNLVAAINTASSHINGLPSYLKSRKTSIMFLTDGQAGCANSQVASLRASLKVDTFVIGFGGGVSASCLNNMAISGGTALSGSRKYYQANNRSELNRAMAAIANAASKEICNNQDDDCDGQIDEGLRQNCRTQCGSGTRVCSRGRWGACSAGTPRAERCNNQDDDCDGRVDENFTNKGRSCTVGTNACRRTGRYICNAAQTGTVCSARPGTPTTERCDGIDNDCDGRVDENFTNKGRSCIVGQGICRRYGTYVCNSSGSGTTCSARPGTAVSERCDGIDNDCDGRVDENWPQKGRSCTVGRGECRRSGTWLCASNGAGVACSARAGSPSKEICDGKDNNCDGRVDEGCQCIDGRTQNCFSGSTGCTKTGASSYRCTAPCRTGTQVCANGRWGTCAGQVTAKAEICDGRDNNCDGRIDENWSNKGRSCTVGVGACKNTGIWRCKSNQSGVECSAQPKAPSREICNNKDDDCDGQIDENIQQACSTPCESGTETCQAGHWINCSARKPTREICDGKDNDCDGQTDEDFTNKGRSCSVGIGACKNTGKWQCKNDQTGLECSVQPNPATKETCDGKDNDCDGQVDEDFTRKGTSCSVGIGECKRNGKLICKQDATDLECSVPAGSPAPEICDGKDNDCNGQTDENIRKACKSSCGSGFQVCKAGNWEVCNAPQPQKEVCDNVDNDCNGTVDEKLKRKCTTICGDGLESCISGKWVLCDAQKPQAEICDGKDNDCNGKIDDLPSKKCSGACGTGTAICQNGQWTGCSGPQPSAEVCDGKDNDCDGKIDNAVWKDCRGACGAGRQLCINGVWGECNAPLPQPEACDGKDNDCDGIADNKAKCPAGTTCQEGQCKLKCRNGECPGGVFCSEGFCEGDLCLKIKCAAGKQCISGKCVAPCDLVTCPSKYVCEKGKCIKDDCYRNGCPSKQRCVRGLCEANPCQDVSCASDQFCRDGKCIDTCAEIECKTDEKCVDGKCRPDPKKTGPCENIQCPTDQTCDKGKCISNPCTNIECPEGQRCEQGVCDHDPCLNIQCPAAQKCVDGQCFKDNNPPSENPNGENNDPTDGGQSTEKDQAKKEDGTLADGTKSSFEQTNKESDPTENTSSGTLDGTIQDQTIGGAGKNADGSGSGRYQPTGCQCNASQNRPLTPIALLFVFFAAIGFRRKQRKRD